MPVYEFKCEACNKSVNLVYSLKAERPDVEKCPDCQGPLQRIFSVGAVTFVGGGWGSSAN